MSRNVRNALQFHKAGPNRPLGWPILVYALVGGLLAGLVAQLLRQVHNPLSDLGGGTAAWLSIGFLFARSAARGLSLRKGTIWAGAAMVVYLLAWLLAYCVVFGIRDTAGFMAMWRDERPFELAALPVSVVVGFIAAASLRPSVLGSACLAAPLAWSLPEVIRGTMPGPRAYWLTYTPPDGSSPWRSASRR